MQQTTQISRAIKQSTIEERIAAQRPLDPSQLTNRLYSKSGRDNTQQLLIQQPRQGVPKAKKQPLQTIPTSTPVIPQLNLQQAAKRTTQTRTRYTPTQSSRDPSSHQTIQFLNPPLTTGRDATTNRATDPISENVLPNTHLPPLDSNSIKPLSSGADNAQTGRSGSGRRTNRPRSTGRTARELVTSRDYQQSSADIGKEPGSNVLIFIQSLRETGNTLDFVYARPACGQYDSLNPYDLIVVPYEKINKTDYYTVSTKGITHFFHGVVDFTSLEEWEKERKYYNLLLLIPTFKDYRVWRSFAAWESYVRCRRISAAHSILQTTHYLSEPPLQSAMNAVRKECLAFKDQIRLYVVNNQKTYSIDDFLLEREAQSNNFKIQLAEFSNSVVERVAKACHDVMDQKGFLKHESGSNKNATKALTSRRIEKKEGEGTDLDEALAGEMSYTKMAARRQECIRLTNFIRSVDCLLLDVLHHIVLQATYDLHHSLKRNLVNPAPTPPSTEAMDKLRNMIQKKRADDEEERLKEEIVRQKLEEEKRMAEDLKNPKKSKSAALNAGFQMRKNMSRSTLHPQTKSQKTVVIEDTIPGLKYHLF
ncbi:putative Dynein axonemal heavy chain 6 [Blattamonas nauphoetae]|uniref:Dynein axonemal heavy chain 6 n=1 Tax=Blattamonas nauphoetae TaxID=2049346 RepID=A0ABQ9XWM7_9EUKA|nr:putative Dynein axonemal heavy chain 6 [Blattamonas nauphoetae]